MADVIDFKSRQVSATPPPQSSNGRPVVPAPHDGLVLACYCSSTLHELLNAGVVRCSRCGCYGKVTWSWLKPTE